MEMKPKVSQTERPIEEEEICFALSVCLSVFVCVCVFVSFQWLAMLSSVFGLMMIINGDFNSLGPPPLLWLGNQVIRRVRETDSY